MKKETKKPKAKEIELRRMQVERLHIAGLTVAEIAIEVVVDERTVSRDIQENRKERLRMLAGGDANEAKNWLRNQLADYIAFMDSARRTFCEQSQSFKNEAAKTKALWCAVQIENQRVETIKSLMFSLDDLKAGGFELDEKQDAYED